ncbi:MAG: phosphoribosyltransferase family protein [Clostridia bacterium]
MLKIIDVLFAKRCIICRKKGHDICEECLKKSQEFFIKKPNKDGVIYAYKYKKSLRDAFISYKFYGKKGNARGLSTLFLEKLKYIDIQNFDIITYVPISKKRMHKRGFNQCELLCDEFCKFFDIKAEKILIKKNTREQSKLSGNDRKVNIIDTFVLKKDVENKRILVIDDVYTTGATMNEVIRTINLGNPSSVTGCVLFKSSKNDEK